MRRVAAVVLAAGEGRRFGGPTHKLLAELRGRPVVAWAVEAAFAAGLDATAVVTGAVGLAAVLPADVVRVDNPRWAEGQATSLAAAIAWADPAGFDAVVVGVGDQPFVPASAWQAVAAGDGRHPIVAAAYAGQRASPVRLDRSIWSLLPREGDAGARVLMSQRPDLVGAVPCDGSPADIDTVEDLERWS
ncbi:MAG: nucleotidyltransferase family protein [Acidimicrobiales bacterium]